MKDLLEVLRVQRHNFVNHLQVISGLLQLKKYDRALEYIRQVGEEYNQASLVGRLEVPEIASAILVAELAAAKQGVTLNKKITTNLDKGLQNPREVAELVSEMLRLASAQAESNLDDTLDLIIDMLGDNYIFEVSCKGPTESFDESFKGLLASAEAADGTGHPLEIVKSDAGVILSLTVSAEV